MAHNNKSPAYISDVTLPVSRDLSRSRLRSADTTDFIVPRTRTKFGERAFRVSGPTIWNSLPEYLRIITFFILAINFLFFYCIDFCIARPIQFVVGLALNTYDDDDDTDLNVRTSQRYRRQQLTHKSKTTFSHLPPCLSSASV